MTFLFGFSLMLSLYCFVISLFVNEGHVGDRCQVFQLEGALFWVAI